MSDLLREICAHFESRPLGKGDEGLRFELDRFRGEPSGAAARLARVFAFAGRNVRLPLSGHAGCGLSTEIAAAANRLEASDPKILVAVRDCAEDLDLADLDFPDLLLSLMRGLAGRLASLNVAVRPRMLSELARELLPHADADLELDALPLEAALADVLAGMAASAVERRRARERFEERANLWLRAANELVREATAAIEPKGYAGLLLIADGLERALPPPRDSGEYGPIRDPRERLFGERAALLRRIDAHFLLTVPIDLCCSSPRFRIESAFGETIRFLPLTRVRGRPPGREPVVEGHAALRALATLRLSRLFLPQSGASGETAAWGRGPTRQQAFAPDALELLVESCGGRLSAMFDTIREAAAESVSHPIPLAAARRTIARRRAGFAAVGKFGEREAILRTVAATGAPPPGADESDFRALLACGAILRREDDEGVWLDANPLAEPPAVA